MKEYFYMRELMDYFKISRDAIKYYEQKGLITSCRDKNGYRKFDRVMFKKLERICTMRSLGFSLDEIKLSIFEGQMYKNGELAFEARIKEIEQQERLLGMAKKLLLSNREFSRSFSEYYQNCHLYEDFFVCLSSRNEEECQQEALWRRELHVFEIDEHGEIQSEQEYQKVIQDEIVVDDDICSQCEYRSKGRIKSSAIRLVIKKSESDRLPEYIREMYRWGIEHDCHMEKKVYSKYSYYCEPEEEGIVLDLYLPVKI